MAADEPSAEGLWRSVVDRAMEVGGRLAVAALVLTGFLLVSRLLRPLVRVWLARRRRPSYARVFSGLFAVVVGIVGALIAATIAFPSVEVADILASLGIISVAVGFAFKDVLENLLAGVLLILRDPFQSGDEISVGDVEGTVEGITVRETLLRTFDGRRVLVPNAKVFTDVIEVRTHFPAVRSAVTVRVAPHADLGLVRTTVRTTVAEVEGVEADPPPQAVVTEVDPSAAVVECRYWTPSPQQAVTAARDRALVAVHAALAEHGVPSPIDHVVVDAPGLEAAVRGPADT